MSPRSTKRVKRAGFSIIELMTVMAIVGLLASIAVPTYTHVKNKSKTAERDTMVRSIEISVIEYLARKDQFPNIAGNTSFLFGDWNPAWPPVTTKRPFDPNLGNWSVLTFRPSGPVAFSYQVFGFQSPTSSYFYVYAVSDVDGDGDYGWRFRQWTLASGGWDISADQAWGDL
jgi:type IV pilus assembly protein PilA